MNDQAHCNTNCAEIYHPGHQKTPWWSRSLQEKARPFFTQLWCHYVVELDQMITLQIFLKCHRLKKNTKPWQENVIKMSFLQICVCLIRTSLKGKWDNTANKCTVWVDSLKSEKLELDHSGETKTWLILNLSKHPVSIPCASRTSSHASWISASGTTQNYWQWSVASKAIWQTQKS